MTTLVDVANALQLLYRQAQALTKNRDDAQDLVQDTFLQASRYLHTYKAQNLGGWLYTMMRNLFLTERRSARVRRMVSMEQWHDAPYESAAEGEWDAARTLELVDELSPDHKAVLALVVSGASYLEMVDALGIPEGTVKTRILRGRAALKKRLEQNSPPTH